MGYGDDDFVELTANQNLAFEANHANKESLKVNNSPF